MPITKQRTRPSTGKVKHVKSLEFKKPNTRKPIRKGKYANLNLSVNSKIQR